MTKVSMTSICDILRKQSEPDELLRSEIFGVEQMQEYGKTLAQSHVLNCKRAHRDRLLSRLEDNERVLDEVRAMLTETVEKQRRIVPAADWLLDNFYLIEDHIRTSKRDLPKGYSKELPQLSNNERPGIPRVYDIALQRISHCDGLVDPETLPGFLKSYQSISILTLGELWAIPIMFRLALIENLRRIATRIENEMRIQETAALWADRMIKLAATDPKSLILLVADMARSDQPLVGSFVAEIARKLQGKGPALNLPLTWIDQRLGETGLSIDQLVQAEMHQQATDQVSVSNTIRSLRSLGAKDWKDFVESTSSVEKKLREDPAKTYESMDFATRDRYRHVVEETAKKARITELAVADRAIELATLGQITAGSDGRETHVGYYLIDRGLTLLERTVSVRRSPLSILKSIASKKAPLIYIGSILLSGIATTALFISLASHGNAPKSLLLFLIAPVFLATVGFAVTLANWIVTTRASPHRLPRMDYSEGIPPLSTTLVVIPSMLTCLSEIELLAGNLEVRFLANRGDNLYFGLLTDFPDAEQEILTEDASLLSYAQEKIEELNNRYGDSLGGPFFLFHRGRTWNPSERTWMGHERKRGKLADLNELLLSGKTSPFDRIVGNIRILPSVRFILTLDADTVLPRDSVRRLAGTMAHPLNRARYDAHKGRITEGYGILQPRVAASLSGENRSLYALINDNDEGIDPYTRAVSDVYQDLFGEGSFIGKGIYDVDAFSMAIKDKLPENRILSHDLLEGCYARSGLVSDIQLFERTPLTYLEDVQRRKRWLRGDWQLLRWLFPGVPSLNGKIRKNPLSALSRWKILDNLRRSLSAIAMTSLFIVGWTSLANPLLWTLAMLGIIFVPPLAISAHGFYHKPDKARLIPFLVSSSRASFMHVGTAFLILVSLPYEAYFSLCTIMRALWRMTVTHRHLLEWKPSDQNDDGAAMALPASFRAMWFAPSLSIALIATLAYYRPSSLLSAVPLLLLWAASPAMIWLTGKPLPEDGETLTVGQTAFLRRIARKTWAFFETFVTAEENWLPPDNVQEIPAKKIAHRTSPTNIGLSLLAGVSARDFGYISQNRMIERTTATIETFEKLEKHRGHLLNWYDTTTLSPLLPRYVSTVDSGNLAASLLTLRAAMEELADIRIFGKETWQGIEDTCLVIDDLLEGTVLAELAAFKSALQFAQGPERHTLREAWIDLESLCRLAASISDAIKAAQDMRLLSWTETLEKQCREHFADIEYLAPWIANDSQRATETGLSDIEIPITLRGLSMLMGGFLSEKALCSPDISGLIRTGLERANDRVSTVNATIARITALLEMDFSFLYDATRRLFSIGYLLSSRRRDSGYYDLLASEARLTSFVAIAQGQIPQENWFALGRLLSDSNGDTVLTSWSGSMFEYLMPLIFMPTHIKTLLGKTCKSAVVCQIEYGHMRDVPWGISESGYNSFDIGLNYQYRAFGVPSLGMKRGLQDDLVIAPYASALSLLVMPQKACQNLQRLSNSGIEGDFGFYEAVDFTKSRVPSGRKSAVVRSFMSHHQGMSLLSLSSCLLGQKMQKRFESIPAVRATSLLLEEKIPQTGIVSAKQIDTSIINTQHSAAVSPARVIKTYDTPIPEVQILSNGKYHLMITNAGGGYSRWRGLSLTRWQEDATSDNRGSFLYIRDERSGLFWSNTYQPTLKKPESYEAVFSEGRAEIRRRDGGIDCYTEIVVSPEDDIELRRIRLTNRSRSRRTIEVTSFSEVVLDTAASDADHPCFGGLFMQSEILPDRQAILLNRRPRSPAETFPVMMHLMIVHDSEVLGTSYETDRLIFIGRGNTTEAPRALMEPGALSGTRGSVLDPIAAIRQRIVLEGDATATIDVVTGIGETREAALLLTEKYRSKRFANRAFELARTHSQILLQQINATESDAHLYSRMANSILFASAHLRTDPGIVLANRRGQSGLWGYSISGDLPIVLLMIKEPSNILLVQQMIQAHSYWHQKGLEVDLVIWNEDHGTYRQQLQEQILSYITAEKNAAVRPGGIFVRSTDQISNEDRILIQTVARIVISDMKGTLERQIELKNPTIKAVSRLIPRSMPRLSPLLPLPGIIIRHAPNAPTNARENLLFKNGIGGFSPDGREYVITTSPTSIAPMPWVNVIANARFGTVISESGMSYTWGENSHEFRITPWYNDPVTDVSGEALYIRDDESGMFWSPSPLPAAGKTPYTTRHGFGYTIFEHTEQGIVSEVCVYVSMSDPVKFSRIKLRNTSGRTRKLSIFTYSELVLGYQRHKNAMHIVTEVDGSCGAMFARNHYNTAFEGRTVFLDAIGENAIITGDRTEFLGRNGSMRNPDAMTRLSLSGQTGPELDPCLAAQVQAILTVGQEAEIVFCLGAAKSADEAISLIRKVQAPKAAQNELDAVKEGWARILSSVNIETPDGSLDILANGWLAYQMLSSRMWGRTGFYQSGGAFGFRDQLQDAMALVHVDPALVREHLLLCASRQFREGDAQHWWHPPLGQGTRTHCSDDYLWLPLAVSRYIAITEDKSILDELVPFIEGPPVSSGEESIYITPTQSSEISTLYDHCVRAISHSEARGVHRLPLMGTGDWNDGMNRVGNEGKGESVWLAFFLSDVLARFAETAALYGDEAYAKKCHAAAGKLKGDIDKHGWDGKWYLRAWFDDGEPLGSSSGEECKIDSIAQSWSVLSGAGERERTLLAMEALDAMLVRREKGLIQLLDPPFDTLQRNPGYIKGYVPGIRENGGQYTHAAIWAAMAFARLGNAQKAWDLTNMINPIRSSDSPEKISVYKTDPYVMAADVYSVSPHSGRGGWTWYTGSAGWMYRLITESLLGISVNGNVLRIAPCVPGDWESYKIHYRHYETMYHINVLLSSSENANDPVGMRVMIDGVEQDDAAIRLVNDRVGHVAEIRITQKTQR